MSFNSASWEKLGNCWHDWDCHQDTEHFSPVQIPYMCRKCGYANTNTNHEKVSEEYNKHQNWNPISDLNQIRELEEKMTGKEMERYTKELIDTLKISVIGDEDVEYRELFNLRNATARQCAVAMMDSGFVDNA